MRNLSIGNGILLGAAIGVGVFVLTLVIYYYG